MSVNPNPARVKSTRLGLGLLLVILVFLGGTIISAFRAAQRYADEMICRNHIKELALQMLIYEQDNGNAFPPIIQWCAALAGNVTNQPAPGILSFCCPSATKKQTCGYAININLKQVKDSDRIPKDTVVLFESDAGWNGFGGPTNAVARHYGSRLWVALADGSVNDVRLDELEKLRWIPSTNVPQEGIK